MVQVLTRTPERWSSMTAPKGTGAARRRSRQAAAFSPGYFEDLWTAAYQSIDD
jgi:hypothetical protein